MRDIQKEYDFSRGKRGAVVHPASGKTRITIRLDTDLLDWFRRAVHQAGGGNYQTLINDALRDHVEARRQTLEQTLRKVVREELARRRSSAKGGSPRARRGSSARPTT